MKLPHALLWEQQEQQQQKKQKKIVILEWDKALH